MRALSRPNMHVFHQIIFLLTPIEGSSTSQSTGPTPAVTPTEDGGTSPVQGQVVHAAFLTIINSVALVSQTLMMWNSEQSGRTGV